MSAYKFRCRPTNFGDGSHTEHCMKQERPDQQLRRRAQSAIIENALFDWKSGVIIALTILLVFGTFPNEQGNQLVIGEWWYWVVGGVVAWIALVVSMLSDPAVNAKA